MREEWLRIGYTANRGTDGRDALTKGIGGGALQWLDGERKSNSFGEDEKEEEMWDKKKREG